MKEVLMIHDVNENILNLPLEDYILTFDDGLYSQFYYWPLIRKIDTEKIFFITCWYTSNYSIERPVFNGKYYKFMNCVDAKQDFEKSGDKSQYMSICEIYKIYSEGGIIGGHSYFHQRNYPKSIVETYFRFKYDTEKMMKWFEEKLMIRPIHYCFPFNKEKMLMREILKKYGFSKFYGSERIPVESLL
jgi:hypothetical protein